MEREYVHRNSFMTSFGDTVNCSTQEMPPFSTISTMDVGTETETEDAVQLPPAACSTRDTVTYDDSHDVDPTERNDKVDGTVCEVTVEEYIISSENTTYEPQRTRLG